MAIVYSYPIASPESQDLLVGTEMALQGGEDAPRTRTFTIGSISDLIKPYKVYIALLNQSGIDAPVATVLENTLGGIPVWTRDGLGYYECTLAGAFPVDKTFCNITIGQDYGNFGTIFFGRSGDNIVNIYYRLYDGSNGIDFDNNPGRDVYVEIRVYN